MGGGFIINGVHVLLHGIARADGCGSSFNLTLNHNGDIYNCNCRTKD